MRVTMMLCDYAQVADGKLFISGGGWSITGPPPQASAIAIKIDVPWDQANTPIRFSLALVEQDGEPVVEQGPMGPQAVRTDGQLEVGRPPGLLPGTPLDVPLAMTIAPLPLAPGSRYTWRLELNGESHDDWQLSFSVRPAPPGVAAAGVERSSE